MTLSRIPAISLPAVDPSRLRCDSDGSGQIYDIVRRKWVELTPEEWVRQCFVDWLVNEKGYSVMSMANERGITVNRRYRRCDTVVFDRRARPLMIIEYKAPSVPVTQKVFDQIVRYNSVLEARYLVVTNGLANYCCQIDYEKGSYVYLPDVPSRNQCVE